MILALFTVVMLGPFTKAGYDFIIEAKSSPNMPKDYVFPDITDMKITAVASVFFAGIEVVMRGVFYKLFVPFCKEQQDLKVREKRSGKAAFCIYKVFYFLTATAWGYFVLKDQYYFPKYLGGSGDFDRGFEEHPYPKHAPQLKEYLLVTMGYHVGGLVTHFFGDRKADFLEMGLHHIVALYLFGGCYMFNGWEVGSTIAFLHDIADITTNMVKTLSESKDKVIIGPLFALHMAIWFYTRLCVLPYLIVKVFIIRDSIYMGTGSNSVIVIPFFCWLLGCMFVLHCYWF